MDVPDRGILFDVDTLSYKTGGKFKICPQSLKRVNFNTLNLNCFFKGKGVAGNRCVP
jgi:hypothetical protein